MATLPLVALTMGDPCGVGPEVIAGVWADPAVHALCRPLVVGRRAVLERAVRLRAPALRIVQIAAPEDAQPAPDLLPCLEVGSAEADAAPPCVVDARGGQAAYDALVAAAQLALTGRVAALTTAPLNKAALVAAGHHYPGHTELLAELCGVRDYAMMLHLPPEPPAAGPLAVRGPAGLSVIHVTLHTALHNVCAELSRDAILTKIRLARAAAARLRAAYVGDGSPPRIGVCALNPHAGESGLFGDEETRLIAPAVAAAQAEGISAEGPLPADTLLVRARDGAFDAVVAMYHDQGHIALKLLGLHRAVNITLGLPIVRTSVAHGTAFDLAWQGRAETNSLVEALRTAALLAGPLPPGGGRSA